MADSPVLTLAGMPNRWYGKQNRPPAAAYPFDCNPRAVTQASKIAFSDLQRMHLEKRSRGNRGRRKLPPDWVFNDNALRERVCQRLEDRFYIRNRTGSYSERLDQIDAAAKVHIARLKVKLTEHQLRYHDAAVRNCHPQHLAGC